MKLTTTLVNPTLLILKPTRHITKKYAKAKHERKCKLLMI